MRGFLLEYLCMADVWDDCSRFVTRHQCKIIAAILGLLLPSVGTGVGWYVASSDELERMAMATDARSLSTASALDAITAEMRVSNKEIIATMQQMQVDIAVLRTRQERERMAPVAAN
jgi:hypothetical protein